MQLNESDLIKCQMLLINKCQAGFSVTPLIPWDKLMAVKIALIKKGHLSTDSDLQLQGFSKQLL